MVDGIAVCWSLIAHPPVSPPQPFLLIEECCPGSERNFMMSQTRKLSAVVLFIAGLTGCSSANSTCLQAVEAHPGLTCLDVGVGWYHAQFASQMPGDQHPDRVG